MHPPLATVPFTSVRVCLFSCFLSPDIIPAVAFSSLPPMWQLQNQRKVVGKAVEIFTISKNKPAKTFLLSLA